MKLRSKQGSILAVAMILSIAMAIISVSYVQLSLQSAKNANRAFYYNSAVNVAEAGAEEAMWALNKKDWTQRSWTNVGTSGKDKKFVGSFSSPDIKDANNVVGYFNAHVADFDGPAPTITAEAVIRLASGSELRKQVRLYAKNSNLFLPPFTAIESMKLNGGEIDSYRLADGNYTNAPRRYGTTAASPTIDLGDVAIGSPADIYGYLNVGIPKSDAAAFVNSIKGSVTTDDTTATKDGVVKSGSNLVDTNLISYDFKQDFPAPELPNPWNNYVLALPAENNGYIVLGSSDGTLKRYDLTSASVKSKIVVVGPVQIYCSGSFEVKSTGAITLLGPGQKVIGDNGNALKDASGKDITGSVDDTATADRNESVTCELYARGDVSISGNGALIGIDQQVSEPDAFKIYGMGTSTQKISVGGNGNMAAVVYAPQAEVTFNGGGSSGYFAGAVVGRTVTVNGQGYRIRFPEELSTRSYGSTYEIAKWVELTNRADWYTF